MRGIIRCADVHVAALEKDKTMIEAVYAPLIGRADLTAQDLVSSCGEYDDKLSDPWEHGNYSRFIRMLSPSEKKQWDGLYNFLVHDITHIEPFQVAGHHSVQTAFWNYRGMVARGERERSDKKYRQDILAPEWQDLYQKVLPLMPDIITQLKYPHQFAKAIAELKLGKKISDLERVDVQRMLEVILRTLQTRFIFDDYLVTTPDSRRPERNELVMDLSPSCLETNPGMLWSILYNLTKNPAKEVSSEDRRLAPRGAGVIRDTLNSGHDLANRLIRGELPEKPIKIYVKLEDLGECDATIIHIMDSGEGLRVDEIVDSMKAIVSKELLQEADLRVSVKRILAAWEDNPFAVRALRMGDVYDLAGLARVSGFVTRERTKRGSSGLGLWGATYLTKRMGGEIIYTNTKDGGAMFSIIVPNHYFTHEDKSKNRMRGEVRQIRKQLERGTGFLHTLPSRAA
jgi:hypothetical protein